MLFNSFDFLIFLPIVFALYWFVFNRTLKIQNAFIVVVSYIFYGWWDWRFLVLIAFTSACSYFSGLMIERSQNTPPLTNHAKIYTSANVIINLLILATFKYFNFFSENFEQLFQVFGVQLDWITLDVLLPVGISFYTFQALSYTIDVYRGSIKPTHSAIDLFAYISFFPQLVAGPIERATNLLPQFYKKRVFDYDKAADGCRQILWGAFKKIIIADMCAAGVNNIFASHADLGGGVLLLGAVLFTFQIYGDFSGYSDMAIGVARLFGIDLMKNFSLPYFSRDIAEFWRRWHISLTTWFRDYIYIPLGGSRGGRWMKFRNTMVIFLVSGFWHGANWTFIAWGAYHALLFLPLMLTSSNRKNRGVVAEGRLLPSLREALQMVVTFALVVVGWIIFRANSIGEAWAYVCGIFVGDWSSAQSVTSLVSLSNLRVLMFGMPILIIAEWCSRSSRHALDFNPNSIFRYRALRWGLYYVLVIFILLNVKEAETFIYFQF